MLQARLELQAKLGRRVTQLEVAEAVGVTQTSVARWERGEKEPDLATIVRLAAALQVEPAALAFGAGAIKGPPEAVPVGTGGAAPLLPERANADPANYGDVVVAGLSDGTKEGTRIDGLPATPPASDTGPERSATPSSRPKSPGRKRRNA